MESHGNTVAQNMLLVAKGDETIRQRIAQELSAVEAVFCDELISDLPCVNELAGHIERYRGKMLRPMLVLTTGLACSEDGQTLTDGHRVIAAVTEMVHMATLVHDDVLDEADVRRRGATVNQLKGNETAVMLGDYLISHAYHLCSSLNDPPTARAIAQATNTVCEGELLQLSNRNNWQLDEAVYFEIIRRKTASLCGVCCELGAALQGADIAARQRMARFGELLGTAFQIVDDVLDLVGDPATVGKTLGRDLEKGKLTLPMIHYLASADSVGRAQLLGLLETCGDAGEGPEGRCEPQAQQVREILAESDAVEYARNTASSLVGEARDLLEHLPESSARSLLTEMAEAVLTRRF